MPGRWKTLAGFRFLVPNSIRAIALLRLCIVAAVSWCAPRGAEAQAKAPATTQFQNLASALTVAAGVTCLDSAELVEHVSSWLGTDRVSAPLAIEVHGSPYFARTVWFRIRRGAQILAERRFEPAPARCDDLHAAVGLAIALALKATLLDSLIGGAQAHGEAHASRPLRLAAQALGGLAVMPGADVGLSVSLQSSLAERFAARFALLALVGPRGDFEHERGRFETWLGAGRLDVCSRLVELSSLDVSACVGVVAGGLYAMGEAFPMSRHALIAYLAVANALELDLELGAHWSLTLAVDLLVPLRRTSFVVRDQAGRVTATHDPTAAGGLLAVGPAYHF
jgi:hypothetical protein